MIYLFKTQFVFIASDEFFLKGFFDKVIVNMTSCSNFDGDDDKANEKHNGKKASLAKRDDMVLIVLEALPAHIGWK